MNTITVETTVGEIVRSAPARSRIFEKLGIDYCCGGKKSLAEASRAKGLDPATLVAMLTALDDAPVANVTDPDRMTLSELCDHIEEVHHGYLGKELPRLDFMTRKVAAVHGADEPRLVQLRQVFETFNAAMSSHTIEEDELIFPAIRKLTSANGPGTNSSSALKGALDKLAHEHDQAGHALQQFRRLTDNYAPPEWACNTFRAMYDGLEKLEKDMHQHVHKENNVLFPKVLASLHEPATSVS